MKTLIIVVFQLITFSLFGQYSYSLLDKSKNAQLNYNNIDSINNVDRFRNIFLDSVFNITNGKNNVYRFTAAHRMINKWADSIDVTELLILVVSNKNEIIDGYQYTLDYPEVPATCDLYRLSGTQKNIKLKKKFQLNKLQFELVENSNYCGVPKYMRFDSIIKVAI